MMRAPPFIASFFFSYAGERERAATFRFPLKNITVFPRRGGDTQKLLPRIKKKARNHRVIHFSAITPETCSQSRANKGEEISSIQERERERERAVA